jgi:hypothetical protein
MHRYAAVFVAAVCAISFYAFPVLAHTTGAFWSVPVGAYTVDVGYDPVSFTTGQYARFDFLLWNGPADTGTQADFAEIWVRIIGDNNASLLATGIWKQPYGPTTLLYEFAKPGTYTLETSYRNADGKDIAVGSFPITVVASNEGGVSLRSAVPFLFGVLVGAFAIALWGRRKTS